MKWIGNLQDYMMSHNGGDMTNIDWFFLTLGCVGIVGYFICMMIRQFKKKS